MKTRERIVKLVFSSLPNRLKLVRCLVESTAEMMGCNEAVSKDIALAVNEACANVIQHTYRGATDKEIILVIERQDRYLEFLLSDFGDRVDPAKIKPRDLDDVRPGGLGSHFIRKIMDSVDYMPGDAVGNKLIMKKKIE